MRKFLFILTLTIATSALAKTNKVKLPLLVRLPDYTGITTVCLLKNHKAKWEKLAIGASDVSWWQKGSDVFVKYTWSNAYCDSEDQKDCTKPEKKILKWNGKQETQAWANAWIAKADYEFIKNINGQAASFQEIPKLCESIK